MMQPFNSSIFSFQSGHPPIHRDRCSGHSEMSIVSCKEYFGSSSYILIVLVSLSLLSTLNCKNLPGIGDGILELQSQTGLIIRGNSVWPTLITNSANFECQYFLMDEITRAVAIEELAPTTRMEEGRIDNACAECRLGQRGGLNWIGFSLPDSFIAIAFWSHTMHIFNEIFRFLFFFQFMWEIWNACNIYAGFVVNIEWAQPVLRYPENWQI